MSAQADAILARSAPAEGWTAAQVGIFWAAKGAWDRAHAAVQDDASKESAWVHAHLHRAEGDLGNAGYWYRRAGRPAATGDPETERRTIAAVLFER